MCIRKVNKVRKAHPVTLCFLYKLTLFFAFILFPISALLFSASQVCASAQILRVKNIFFTLIPIPELFVLTEKAAT